MSASLLSVCDPATMSAAPPGKPPCSRCSDSRLQLIRSEDVEGGGPGFQVHTETRQAETERKMGAPAPREKTRPPSHSPVHRGDKSAINMKGS